LAALQIGLSRPVANWPDREWRDYQGHTIWHYWAASGDPLAQWPALRDEQSALRDTLSHQGAHPLHALALRGDAGLLRAWAQAFGVPSVGVWQGDTLLHCALWSGDPDTIEQAMAWCPEGLQRPDGQGWPPLVIALYRSDEALALKLARAGADPDAADPVGRTALHHAALLGMTDFMGTLEDLGGSMLAPDHDGLTPEDIAAGREGRRAASGNAFRAHWARKYTAKLAF
jgi:ankyrin repeat protein